MYATVLVVIASHPERGELLCLAANQLAGQLFPIVYAISQCRIAHSHNNKLCKDLSWSRHASFATVHCSHAHLA